MNFFKQIFAETKKMLRSKFILISGILVVAFVVGGVPLMELITNNMYGSYYPGGMETVTIDGVDYENENQLTWELSWLLDQQEYMTNAFQDTETLKLAEEINNRLIDFYSTYAPLITGQDDYRSWMSYEMSEAIKDIFVIENLSEDETEILRLTEAISFIGYNLDEITIFSEMTEVERAERISELEMTLSDYDRLVVENDFSAYVDLQKRNLSNEIEDAYVRIETLEQDTIEDPSQEQYVSQEIRYLETRIKDIEENQIPELDFRLENNIAINDGSWQDEALSEITNNNSNILYAENNTMTEEEFFQDNWQVEQYGTYEAYLESVEKDIQDAQFNILVAQSSLDSGKPDMKFVPDGSRAKLYGQFTSSFLVAVFGVLIGGWVMASEFQVGTIRLLMIRPRTRTKVLLSRFLAGLLLVLAVYFLVFFLSFIVSGFSGGFSDYFYPNYTASAEIPFFVAFSGHFFAVFTNMVFAYSLSFALSTIVKNIAVSVVVPTIALIGSAILIQFLTMYPPIDILSFTPLPYIGTLHNFFDGQRWGPVQQLMDKGMSLSLELGVVMLLLYSAIFVVICGIVFRKKDITN